MDLCNASELSAVLGRFGFSFSKALGQNFLVAGWVTEKMLEGSGLDKGFAVLEIGPGAGCLTRELSAAAFRVLCVELDRRLIPVLEYTLSDRDNVEILQADAMELDLGDLCRERFAGLRAAVCSNLPYNITTPVITKLLSSGAFETMTLMVQKEVAVRLCAPPGDTRCGAITIFTQFYSHAKMLFTVPAGCFRPSPKVDSAVIRLDRRSRRAVDPDMEELFFRTVRAAFAQRRKTLFNSLSSGFPELPKERVGAALDALGIDRSIRGEKLSVEDFARLSGALETALRR